MLEYASHGIRNDHECGEAADMSDGAVGSAIPHGQCATARSRAAPPGRPCDIRKDDTAVTADLYGRRSHLRCRPWLTRLHSRQWGCQGHAGDRRRDCGSGGRRVHGCLGDNMAGGWWLRRGAEGEPNGETKTESAQNTGGGSRTNNATSTKRDQLCLRLHHWGLRPWCERPLRESFTRRGRAPRRAAPGRHPQLPPHPEPGCDAAIGAMPPVVVVVLGRIVEVDVVLPLVVGGVDETSFEGVTVTS